MPELVEHTGEIVANFIVRPHAGGSGAGRRKGGADAGACLVALQRAPAARGAALRAAE